MTEDALTNDINESITDISISLKAIENDLAVLLTCNAVAVKGDDFFDDIQNRMRFLKITAKPDLVALQMAAKEAVKNGKGLTDFRLAEGVPAVIPVDGRIEWSRDYFKTGYVVDPETKRIDFHQKAGDPSVTKGELLVKVFRAQMGKNGRTVFGKAIIVSHPKDVKIKGGPNVYWDDKVKGYRAGCDGRVKLRGQTLNVDPVYIARNGVGNETGNIKHNGQVIVDGDVDAEFKIEATGDIEIRGLAYACDIICDGNLVAREGINGNLEKSIKIKGDIFAKYLQNSVINSSGNITVNTEIYQCKVDTKGEIICNNGRITGGEVLATKGITVYETGSKGNVKTVLFAGVDRQLQARIKEAFNEISKYKGMIEKLQKGYRKFKENIQLLNNDQKESMTEIEFRMAEGEEEISKRKKEIKDIQAKIRELSHARIKIIGLANPGTVIRISDAQYTIDSVLAGPIYAVFDQVTGQIALTSEDDDEEKDRGPGEAEISRNAENGEKNMTENNSVNNTKKR